ncbi:MAG TPA: DsrE/DsrF/DrsH-like family protein [Streptosporangiaceae bacterium]|nr:DsrE/DsrF/DrsH-like family protein [Streptosporangiaceae bacterium]
MLDEAHAAPAATPDVAGEELRRMVREEVERALARDAAARRTAIIASKGTLDWAYPPLILATTAAASGMETAVFFTFYGLNIIHRDFERKLKIGPVGNPAMPMPVPMPDLLTAMPGMIPAATAMMKKRFAKRNVATIRELLDAAREAEVRLIACQMTVDVFGYEPSEFIEGVEFGGAAAFLSEARRGHVTLFI